MEKDFEIVHKNPVDKTGMDAEDIELIATESALTLAIILGANTFDSIELFDFKHIKCDKLSDKIVIYQNNTILYEIQRS